MRIQFENPFEDWLTGEGRRQVPFAMSMALNDVAFASRKAVVDALPQRFTIRSGKFLPGSIQVDKATKRTLTATVGVSDRAAFLVKQEEGGEETPREGRKALSVPSNVRKSDDARIPKTKRPAPLMQRKDTFIYQSKNGAVVAQRIDRKTLIVLWGFEQEARYQQRFHFLDTVDAEATAKFDNAMYEALKRAFN